MWCTQLAKKEGGAGRVREDRQGVTNAVTDIYVQAYPNIQAQVHHSCLVQSVLYYSTEFYHTLGQWKRIERVMLALTLAENVAPGDLNNT